MTEVDNGGGGHRTRLKINDQLVCPWGAPFPIYKGVQEGEGRLRDPGLGGLRTARLYPLAGLLDYEDTRLKTSSRVRMGLYLAWKAI